MSTYNIGLYEDMTKIIFQLSSNTHLISSSEKMEPHRERKSVFGVSDQVGHNRAVQP